MSSWQPSELAVFATPDEIRVVPDRADGSAGTPVIVWAVRVGDALYARSARGPEGRWYRRAIASGHGSILAGASEREVAFVDVAATADHAAIDAAYHAEYDRYGARVVGSVVGEGSYSVTVRIDPVG